MVDYRISLYFILFQFISWHIKITIKYGHKSRWVHGKWYIMILHGKWLWLDDCSQDHGYTMFYTNVLRFKVQHWHVANCPSIQFELPWWCMLGKTERLKQEKHHREQIRPGLLLCIFPLLKENYKNPCWTLPTRWTHARMRMTRWWSPKRAAASTKRVHENQSWTRVATGLSLQMDLGIPAPTRATSLRLWEPQGCQMESWSGAPTVAQWAGWRQHKHSIFKMKGDTCSRTSRWTKGAISCSRACHHRSVRCWPLRWSLRSSKAPWWMSNKGKFKCLWIRRNGMEFLQKNEKIESEDMRIACCWESTSKRWPSNLWKKREPWEPCLGRCAK